MLLKKNNLLNQKFLKYWRWLDFQYLTIIIGLKRIKSSLNFTPLKILDVGAGEWNYRPYFLPPTSGARQKFQYITYDPYVPADVKDLSTLAGQKFDLILVIEVLEHVADAGALLDQLRPFLANEGVIIISTPFAARLHYCPEDYGRFTKAGLSLLAMHHEFTITKLFYRGHTLQTLANKMIYFFGQGLLRFNGLWPAYFILGLLALPLFIPLLITSYLCLLLPASALNQDDPLGLMAVLKKKT